MHVPGKPIEFSDEEHRLFPPGESDGLGQLWPIFPLARLDLNEGIQALTTNPLHVLVYRPSLGIEAEPAAALTFGAHSEIRHETFSHDTENSS